MKLYYLIDLKDRLMITDESKSSIERQVHADSWIEAKQKLGFELSVVQTLLLEKQRTRRVA